MTPKSAGSEITAAIAERIAHRMDHTVADLIDLARIPGCAFPGFPSSEVDRAARKVADLLEAAGSPTVQVIRNGDFPPAVYAEIPGPPDAPTVLLYAHYDVQPAGDESAWSSPPFEPEVRDGRLYGRGVADDKSGVIMHAATVAAFPDGPPCTLRIIIEGDEEYGGSFENFPREHPEMFAADALIIADSGNIEVGLPTFTSALRGMAMVTVTIETLESPVHSGLFGGPAPDALMALVTLLATLRDDNGDTSIDGVAGYEWVGAAYDEDTFRQQAGVLPGQPLLGTGSIGSMLYSLPAVSVVGIDAPAVTGAINAVVPKARAKVSLRVPPDVDPAAAQAALIRHLESRTPWGVKVHVEPGVTGEGFVADTSGPVYEAMWEAMHAAYGADPVEVGSGGSIPLVAVLREVAPDATIVLCGAQDTSAAIHAPDESVDLTELRHAITAQALFIQNLADGRGQSRATEPS